MQQNVFVIIATSMKRSNLLLSRSLPSVYSQDGIDSKRIKILIVDDNTEKMQKKLIDTGIKKLKSEFDYSYDDFETFNIPNLKTRGKSGTGAWNTGIDFAFNKDNQCYISILDDDDEYLPSHLSDCLGVSGPDIVGVFQQLIWQQVDGSRRPFPVLPFSIKAEDFYIGNPGVQGSNMFIKARLLKDIGGFDESFPNTTDRELLIRLLLYLNTYNVENQQKQCIKLLHSPGVVYHNHGGPKVNSNIELKQTGLELFYLKFKHLFSEESYIQSLNRAESLFKFKPRTL